MRRTLPVFVLLGLVVGFGLFTVPGAPAAQDATPDGEEAPITLESLGSVPAADAPGKQLVLLRVTVAPDGVVPSHVHPGQIVVAVESGTLAYAVLGGEGEVLRGGAGTPTAGEAIAPGEEVVLGPGDWFVEDPAVVHTARNAGDEPAVLLISGLVAADEPFLQPTEVDTGTPSA
jgi:quercetin dioxygenase-like cupin family protein